MLINKFEKKKNADIDDSDEEDEDSKETNFLRLYDPLAPTPMHQRCTSPFSASTLLISLSFLTIVIMLFSPMKYVP